MNGKKWLVWAIQMIAAGSLVVIVWLNVLSTNMDAALELIIRIGPVIAVILLPIVASTMADSAGWKLCISATGHTVRFMPLVKIRFVTDVLSNFLPAGFMIGEPLRPALLHRELQVPTADAVVSAIMMKVGIAVAQGLFFLIGLSLAPLILSPETALYQILDGLRLVAFVFLLICGLIGVVLIVRGGYMRVLASVASILPLGEQRRKRLHDFMSLVDERLRSVGSRQWRYALTSVPFFLVAWISLGAEAYLILHFLGLNASLVHGILMESLTSVLRMGFFAIPGGVGVQDAGHVTMLQQFGFAGASTTGAVFVVLKRIRDLAWIALGAVAMGSGELGLLFKRPTGGGESGEGRFVGEERQRPHHL